MSAPKPGSDRGAGRRQGVVWPALVLACLALAFLAVPVPLPEAGLAGRSRSELGIPHGASGAWVSNPQKVMALGAL